VPAKRTEILASALDLENLRANRVLVLGSDPGLPNIIVVPWEAATDRKVNVADYELVVIDLTSLSLATLRQATAEITQERINRLLRGPQHELVIIGSVPSNPGAFVENHLPTKLSVRAEQGTNLTEQAPEFSRYLEKAGAYEWIVEIPDQTGKTITWQPLVKASRRDTVGVSIRWYSRSRAIWLPAPTVGSVADGIALLLQENYRLGGPTEDRPTWLDEITLPRFEAIGVELDSVNQQIFPLEERRDQLRKELVQSRRFLDCLFQTGDQLENLVRDLLRELEADVSDPEVKGVDDGSLIAPTGDRVVLEIKGRQSQIGLEDVRQLANWVDNRTYSTEELQPEEWQGILIGNPYCRLPLEERGPGFGPNAVDYARRRDLSLLTTAQLIDALRLKQLGKWEPTDWWRRLLESNGPFKWP
jgi:hypothetical protein